MNVSPEGIAKIREHEGCVLRVYNDQAGRPTIGVGHLIVPGESYPTGTITIEQADELLAKDLKRTAEGVDALLEVPVTQAQYDSIVSFAFNLGVGTLAKSTFLYAINSRAPHAEIRERLARYNKVRVNGKLEVSNGLVKRRAEEGKAWP